MGRRGYLHLGHFRICGDVTVVLLGELRFSLAEIFPSGVESGFGHICESEIIANRSKRGRCKMCDHLNRRDRKLFAR